MIPTLMSLTCPCLYKQYENVCIVFLAYSQLASFEEVRSISNDGGLIEGKIVIMSIVLLGKAKIVNTKQYYSQLPSKEL